MLEGRSVSIPDLPIELMLRFCLLMPLIVLGVQINIRRRNRLVPQIVAYVPDIH